MNAKDFETIVQFGNDMRTSMNGKISPEKAAEIEAIYNEFRQLESGSGDYFIHMHMNALHGHMEVTRIENPITDRYDYIERKYVSYSGVMAGILWNDHSKVEPYNRQSQFYNGATFGSMDLVCEDADVRTFKYCHFRRMSEVIDPWQYNSYWGTVEFQAVVKAGEFNQFIEKLMGITGKQWLHTDDVFDQDDTEGAV